MVRPLPRPEQRHPLRRHLRRVLARLDPAAFEKCLLGWIQAVQEVTENRLIAIDGKTLRGSYDRRDGRAAIHMVSAWASENKLSLGQVVVDEKSNEITAIPELLRLLDVSGALVTIDAMGCQKEIADEIREAGRRLRPGRQAEPADAVRAGRGGDRRGAGAGRRGPRRAPDRREGARPSGDADVRDLAGPGDGRSRGRSGGTSSAVGMAISERTDAPGRHQPGGALLHPEPCCCRRRSSRRRSGAIGGSRTTCTGSWT